MITGTSLYLVPGCIQKKNLVRNMRSYCRLMHMSNTFVGNCTSAHLLKKELNSAQSITQMNPIFYWLTTLPVLTRDQQCYPFSSISTSMLHWAPRDHTGGLSKCHPPFQNRFQYSSIFRREGKKVNLSGKSLHVFWGILKAAGVAFCFPKWVNVGHG